MRVENVVLYHYTITEKLCKDGKSGGIEWTMEIGNFGGEIILKKELINHKRADVLYFFRINEKSPFDIRSRRW